MIKNHILGIGHIGIPTSDIEKAKTFYQGLGFKIEGTVNHIAIDIVDADGLFKEISQAGYNIVAPGIEELPFWNSGIKFFKIIGPDSVVIEFCERK